MHSERCCILKMAQLDAICIQRKSDTDSILYNCKSASYECKYGFDLQKYNDLWDVAIFWLKYSWRCMNFIYYVVSQLIVFIFWNTIWGDPLET